MRTDRPPDICIYRAPMDLKIFYYYCNCLWSTLAGQNCNSYNSSTVLWGPRNLISTKVVVGTNWRTVELSNLQLLDPASNINIGFIQSNYSFFYCNLFIKVLHCDINLTLWCKCNTVLYNRYLLYCLGKVSEFHITGSAELKTKTPI